MDYEKLSDIYRKEISNPDLVKVDSDFYKQVAQLINRKKQAMNPSNVLELKEFLNTTRMVDRIINLRLNKIVDAALKGSEVQLTPEESLLYTKIKQAIISFKEEINLIQKEAKENQEVKKDVSKITKENKNQEQDNNKVNESQKDEIKEDIKEENKVGKSSNTIKIKILKYVEKYIGSDGNIYGPYNVDDIVDINNIEGEWLIENGFAEKVN